MRVTLNSLLRLTNLWPSDSGSNLNLEIMVFEEKEKPKNNFSGPVYMEKSCPGKEGHPFSPVNFSERLYEKKVDPFA